MPGAVPDGDVEIALGQVDDLVGGGYPHVDLGAALLKPVQPQHQPFCGERGRRGHGQAAGVVMRAQPPDRSVDPGKGLRQPRQQYSRRRRQLDRPVQPVEQPDPEILLQGVDLMADRGRGHEQLFSRLRKAHMAGGRLEGAQGGERRQMVVHTG